MVLALKAFESYERRKEQRQEQRQQEWLMNFLQSVEGEVTEEVFEQIMKAAIGNLPEATRERFMERWRETQRS